MTLNFANKVLTINTDATFERALMNNSGKKIIEKGWIRT